MMLKRMKELRLTIIVERERKAKTLQKILGSSAEVIVSQPVGGLSLPPEGRVLIATDPDEDGDLRAGGITVWMSRDEEERSERLRLPALEEDAIRRALEETTPVTKDDSRRQQVREQVMMGLWHHLREPLQGWGIYNDGIPDVTLTDLLALAWIVEREWDRYSAGGIPAWHLRARFDTPLGTLDADMQDGPDLMKDSEIYALADQLMGSEVVWRVEDIDSGGVTVYPGSALTSARLYELAWTHLGALPHEVDFAAQNLYDEGRISFAHTMATRIPPEIEKCLETVISSRYSRKAYHPPNTKPLSGKEQAIYPLHPEEEPDESSTRLKDRVYSLIWHWTLASRMEPARFSCHQITIRPYWVGCLEPWEDPRPHPHPFTFKATLDTVVEAGYRDILTPFISDETISLGSPLALLEGDIVRLEGLRSRRERPGQAHPYTPGSLLKRLGTLGLADPALLGTLVKRLCDGRLISQEEGDLRPTPLGEDLIYLCQEQVPGLLKAETLVAVENALVEEEAFHEVREVVRHLLSDHLFAMEIPA